MASAETGVSKQRYWAFISYSQRDVKWAEWLHRELESYRVPADCVGRLVGSLTVPQRLVPVFRDRDELPSAGDIGETIRGALAASSALIVICSPHAAASSWVNKEVQEFKAMGKNRRIFPLIVDGEPYASDRPASGLAECYPQALRFVVAPDGTITEERAEPLAADARRGRDGRRNARLKLIAGVLGVGFDELRGRERLRQRRRKFRLAALAAAWLLAAGAVYLGLADGDVAVPGDGAIRAKLDRHGLSVFRPVASRAEIVRHAAQTRAHIRRGVIEAAVKVELSPGDNQAGVWDIAQAVASVFRDPGSSAEERTRLRPLVDQAFRKDMVAIEKGRRVGWRDTLTLSRAEAALWMIMALTCVHAREDDDSSGRARIIEYLGHAQEIAENYSPLDDGGWNVAQEERPENHHVYTTTLALHALLELRAQGLCWRGDCEQATKRVRATFNWLVRAFDHEEGVYGWRRRLGDDRGPDPDLSMFVYAALGRAGVDLGLEVPDAIVREAIARLIALRNRPYHPAQRDIEHWVRYADQQGTSRLANLPTRVFWYPWSIEALHHWMRFAERAGMPAETIRALERSSSHIAIGLAGTARADLSRALLFVQAETLYGMGSLR